MKVSACSGIRLLLQPNQHVIKTSRGECGAYTLLMDGVPRYACMTLVTEGLSVPETPAPGEEPGFWKQARVEGKRIPRVDAYERVRVLLFIRRISSCPT